MNTSHSLLVSSTNLSFSYVALSSFFSPRASPSPLSLFFSFKVLIVLSRTDRGNGRVIRSYLQKGKPSNTTDFISSFVIDCSYFSSFFFWSLQSSPLPLFLFFSPTNSSARVDQSRRKKEKKKKGNNVRSIILSSRFDHSMIIPYLFLKKIFLSSLCFNGHRRSTGRTMDIRTIFRECAIYLACPILIEDERNTWKTRSMPCAPFLFFRKSR